MPQVLIKNNQVQKYPYSVQQFRIDNPNISLPLQPTEQSLNDAGIYSVDVVNLPVTSVFQMPVEQNPELVNGQWTQIWGIREATAEETEANKSALIKDCTDSTQRRLDTFAQSRGYDGILSLCTYATSAVPKFQAEGQYGVSARDNTWATLSEILAEVQAGTRPIPVNFAEIEPELPELVWPNLV